MSTSPDRQHAELERRISRISKLAAFPQVAWQLMGALRDERTTPRRLQRIIESDMALAAKVVSVANSAYYGVQHKVTTVERAIVIIGYQELELMALSAGLADIFDLSGTPAGFDGEGLWIHSIAVSRVARDLAEAAFYADPGEVMVAGLLHDLGKLLLATHLTSELEAILRLVDDGVPYYEAEERLECPHALAGRLLAEAWNLPPLHVSVIARHHQPLADDPHFKACCLVALANIIVKGHPFGLATEARYPDTGVLLNGAGLDETRMDRVREASSREIPAMTGAWLELIGKSR